MLSDLPLLHLLTVPYHSEDKTALHSEQFLSLKVPESGHQLNDGVMQPEGSFLLQDPFVPRQQEQKSDGIPDVRQLP